MIFQVTNKKEIADLFLPLKKVSKERQSPAHKINDNRYDPGYNECQKNMMKDVYNSFHTLRKIFQQHPKASNFKIPEWLDKGKIKSF